MQAQAAVTQHAMSLSSDQHLHGLASRELRTIQAHILGTSGIEFVPKRADSYLDIIMDDRGEV